MGCEWIDGWMSEGVREGVFACECVLVESVT
jgi:hypothetical protein